MISPCCVECGGPLPLPYKPRRKYCSPLCASRFATRAWKAKHPNYSTNRDRANREHRRAQKRALYAKDPAGNCAKVKAWQAKNKETIKAYKERNKERIRDQARARYAADPVGTRAGVRRSRQKRLAYYRLKEAEARAKNRDKLRLASRRYHQAHPHWKRSSEAKRRALKKGVNPIDCSRVKRFYRAVSLAADAVCRWCSQPVPRTVRHVDHIIPLSRGGRHVIENLCCSCFSCNVNKRSKTPEEWLPIAVIY